MLEAVRIPLEEIILAVKDGKAGRDVIPDHPVQPSIDDVLHNVDRELEKTLKLIQSSR